MYVVIILAEQAMTVDDAERAVALHDDMAEERTYHVLLPCENARARVESALSALAAGELMAVPTAADGDEVEEAQADIDRRAASEVDVSVQSIRATGHAADGEFSCDDPIDKLEELVHARDANEIIVFTRPHVIREMLRLDWTSRARRRVAVPTLHLIEHEPDE